MRRTHASVLLIAFGALLIVAGLVVMLAVAPQYRSVRKGDRYVQRFEGKVKRLVDPQTLEDLGSTSLVLDRAIRVEQISGAAALIHDERVLSTPDGRLSQTNVRYALGRMSMTCTEDHPAGWSSLEGFWPRRGLMDAWPFRVQQRDYWGWVDEYRSLLRLRFVGEVEHERSGLMAYRFASGSDRRPMAAAQVEFLGLPTSLAKEDVYRLVDLPQVNPVLQRLLPEVLDTWTGQTVPVEYSYEVHTQYWVEPQTGVLLDMSVRETIRLGLDDQVAALSALTGLTASQRAALQATLYDASIAATDTTVADARRHVTEKLRPVRLYGTYLPIALIVAGLAIAAVGGSLLTRHEHAH